MNKRRVSCSHTPGKNIFFTNSSSSVQPSFCKGSVLPKTYSAFYSQPMQAVYLAAYSLGMVIISDMSVDLFMQYTGNEQFDLFPAMSITMITVLLVM